MRWLASWWRCTLAGASLVALVGCTPDRWTGFAYPDKHNLAHHENLGDFESLQACRAGARARLGDTFPSGSDYECGLNCEASRDLPGMNVCKVTER